MMYWGIWFGGMVGVLLGVLALHITARKFEWPLRVAISIAIIVICVCFLLGYWVECGTNPGFVGFW